MKSEAQKSVAALKHKLPRFQGYVAMILAALVTGLSATKSYAGSATWRLSPRNGDWNTTANWMPRTVPNGLADIATFDFSNFTDISVSANTTISDIVFNSGAAAFTTSVNPGKTLTLSGSGMNNNSNTLQNLVATSSPEGISGVISFTNNATAGNQTVFTAEGSTADQAFAGTIRFSGSSSAANGEFIIEGSQPNGSFASGLAEFEDQSTAGNGVFTNLAGGFGGGVTLFHDSSTAGIASFTCAGGAGSGAQGGNVIFAGTSSAANGTFMAYGPTEGYPGRVHFMDFSTADHGIFTVHGGTVSGLGGAEIIFMESSTAGNGTFVIEGSDVSGAEGGELIFFDDSDGGAVRLEVFGNGAVFIRTNISPFTVGSIEGDGLISTAKTLEVGGNNLSTVFSGVIEGGGNSPVQKVGTGTLTLSGASTYLGGTVMMDGALKVDNTTGSGTGTGPVAVDGGTLGGMGIIAGTVTVGTGGGSGAFLEPSVGASRPTTLTIQSALTLKADGTYTWQLNTKKARADQVLANGVTIESGAQFNLRPIANKRLTVGTVLTAISNTSATPIAGTFANLPDGSVFTVGRNNYQISYSGGDGNDLTLTVVP